MEGGRKEAVVAAVAVAEEGEDVHNNIINSTRPEEDEGVKKPSRTYLVMRSRDSLSYSLCLLLILLTRTHLYS